MGRCYPRRISANAIASARVIFESGKRVDSERAENDSARIRAEADRVLAAEVFSRSPVLSRLLTYLVERTLAGEPIKSYTIAVEGLGRSEDESEEADTYARVAVGRLRRALSSHYESQPPGDRLHIDKGTYEVRIVQGGTAVAPASVPGRSRALRGLPINRTSLKWLAALFVLLGAAALLFDWWSERIDPVWLVNNTPTVSVVAAVTGLVSGSATEQLEAQRQELTEALSHYVGLRVVEDARVSEFVVQLRLMPTVQGEELNITLMENASHRVAWAEDFRLERGPEGRSADDIAALIATPGGALNSYLRRRGYKADSPRGCWLRFTAGVQTFNTIGDDDLAECARAWYRASPQRPTAAFLYGWTLTDRSVWEMQGKRDRSIKEAIAVLRKAVTLNPDVAPLKLALTRAYAFSGDRTLVVQAANDAIQARQSNRLVKGMAASLLVFWNDPAGESVLQDLKDTSGEKYPWEHVGLFIAAMMRDDVQSAQPHILHLERHNTGQPLLLLLRAACFAKAGQQAESQAALRQLRSDPRILVAGTDAVIGQLPMAPEVRHRLSEWVKAAD